MWDVAGTDLRSIKPFRALMRHQTLVTLHIIRNSCSNAPLSTDLLSIHKNHDIIDQSPGRDIICVQHPNNDADLVATTETLHCSR